MKKTTQTNLDGIPLKNTQLNKKLTWRQKQTLLAIYWEVKNYGSVTFSNLVGDIGVASITMSIHLGSLQKKGHILKPAKQFIEMSFEDKLELTEDGINTAEEELHKINSTINDSLDSIFEKLKTDYEKLAYTKSTGFNLTSNSFSKAYTDLIKNKNLTEPVITSIALYAELDSQLNLLMMDKVGKKLNPVYRSLTQNKLSTIIRTGRLSSIAIPIMLKGQVSFNEARNILEDSWAWLNTVQNRQINRYMNEASSLGLITQNAGMISSLKPSATDLILWLATKTGDAFMNTVNPAPKASLIVYKESFNLPTIEDLLSPQNSNLEWAQQIYDDTPKDVYTNSINDAVDILVNQAKVVEKLEGDRLVPKTVMREVNEAPDIKVAFDTILKFSKKENNYVSNVLLAIIANPGITIQGLYNKVKSSTNIELNQLESVITNLAGKGFVHIARSLYSKDLNTVKLYAFSHIPHFEKSKSSNDDNLVGEANAVSKGMEPWILSSIKDFFPSNDEKIQLYEILNYLLKEKEISFDDIEDKSDKRLSRKMGAWSYTLKPFIESDEDFSLIKIPDSRLGEIILDTLQFSLLTSNDALGIYNSAMSNFISKDGDLMKRVEEDAAILKKELLKTKKIK
ncbi:hypothetical protein MSBR3_0096 [Methanosarcina barkeri 3]|uniref:Uncharacterized protein n=1 Tax=Methanosarcina barkeri 3 TaxID=1434107 RepID=A0A0E3SEQ9_METBA|nr:hypothetical protein [Methanosarcina barkeri]AKB80674.1 hypothetical protein MSBR3_0096 [Methanosarcina barkeri 3]